jgi:hypothetical protein
MRSARGVLVAAVVLTATPSSAAVVRLGLGADYLVDVAGEFNLTLAVGGYLTRYLQVGGRFGALVVTDSPNFFGVPVDLFLRANLADTRVYVEGLVGPWFYFLSPDPEPVRFHAAFGFGIRAGPVQFGIEAGYVSDNGIIGIRIAFPIY